METTFKPLIDNEYLWSEYYIKKAARSQSSDDAKHFYEQALNCTITKENKEFCEEMIKIIRSIYQ